VASGQLRTLAVAWRPADQHLPRLVEVAAGTRRRLLDRDHIGIVQVFESTLRVKKIPLTAQNPTQSRQLAFEHPRLVVVVGTKVASPTEALLNSLSPGSGNALLLLNS